jgi:hypothetical protein
LAERQRARRVDARAAEKGGIQQARAVGAEFGDEAVGDQAAAAVRGAVEGGVVGPGRRGEAVGGKAADVRLAARVDRQLVSFVLSRAAEVGGPQDVGAGAVQPCDVGVLLALGRLDGAGVREVGRLGAADDVELARGAGSRAAALVAAATPVARVDDLRVNDERARS